VDPYVGKDYGNRADSNYEVMTMTLERLYATDPEWKAHLARDPDTARYILGLLALL